MAKRMAGLAAAALLMTAACGDDGDDGEAAATPSDDEGSAAAELEELELSGEFCEDVGLIQWQVGERGQIDPDDAELADATFAQVADALSRMEPPDAMASDWDVIQAAYNEGLGAVDADGLLEAAANLQAYLTAECGEPDAETTSEAETTDTE